MSSFERASPRPLARMFMRLQDVPVETSFNPDLYCLPQSPSRDSTGAPAGRNLVKDPRTSFGTRKNDRRSSVAFLLLGGRICQGASFISFAFSDRVSQLLPDDRAQNLSRGWGRYASSTSLSELCILCSEIASLAGRLRVA